MQHKTAEPFFVSSRNAPLGSIAWREDRNWQLHKGQEYMDYIAFTFWDYGMCPGVFLRKNRLLNRI